MIVFYLMLVDFFLLGFCKENEKSLEISSMSESLNVVRKSKALKQKIIHSFFILVHVVLLDHLCSRRNFCIDVLKE